MSVDRGDPFERTVEAHDLTPRVAAFSEQFRGDRGELISPAFALGCASLLCFEIK